MIPSNCVRCSSTAARCSLVEPVRRIGRQSFGRAQHMQFGLKDGARGVAGGRPVRACRQAARVGMRQDRVDELRPLELDAALLGRGRAGLADNLFAKGALELACAVKVERCLVIASSTAPASRVGIARAQFVRGLRGRVLMTPPCSRS